MAATSAEGGVAISERDSICRAKESVEAAVSLRTACAGGARNWPGASPIQTANTARGTLLALDASHFGAIVGPNLVDAYFSRYRNPEDEFKFKEVWIIGPTVRSSARLKPTD